MRLGKGITQFIEENEWERASQWSSAMFDARRRAMSQHQVERTSRNFIHAAEGSNTPFPVCLENLTQHGRPTSILWQSNSSRVAIFLLNLDVDILHLP